MEELSQRIAAGAILRVASGMRAVTAYFSRINFEFNHNRRVNNANGKSQMILEFEEGKTTGVTAPETLVLRLDTMKVF